MSIAASRSLQRATDNQIYGWSGSQSLTNSGTTLLDYYNPAGFYLTRITLAFDYSTMNVNDVLSYIIQIDGANLFVWKATMTEFVLGIQPQQLEVVIGPNSKVLITSAQDQNRGTASCVLTGFKV